MASCLSTISESHDRKQNVLTSRRQRSALAPGGGGFSWDSAPLVEQLTTEQGEHPKQEELEESVTALWKKKDKIHLLIVPIVVAIYFLFSYTFWQPLWFGAVLFEEISDLSVSKKAGIKEPAAGSLLSSALKKIWEFEIWGEKKREREKKRGQGKHRTPP